MDEELHEKLIDSICDRHHRCVGERGEELF